MTGSRGHRDALRPDSIIDVAPTGLHPICASLETPRRAHAQRIAAWETGSGALRLGTGGVPGGAAGEARRCHGGRRPERALEEEQSGRDGDGWGASPGTRRGARGRGDGAAWPRGGLRVQPGTGNPSQTCSGRRSPPRKENQEADGSGRGRRDARAPAALGQCCPCRALSSSQPEPWVGPSSMLLRTDLQKA